MKYLQVGWIVVIAIDALLDDDATFVVVSSNTEAESHPEDDGA